MLTDKTLTADQSTVTLETVKKLEQLAYLILTDTDRQAFVVDLGKMLRHVASLTEVELSNYAPLTHAMDLADVLRADEVQPSSEVAEALANAPEAAPPYYQVPRVLE